MCTISGSMNTLIPMPSFIKNSIFYLYFQCGGWANKNKPTLFDFLVNIGELNKSNKKLSKKQLEIYSNRKFLQISRCWSSKKMRSKENENTYLNQSQSQSQSIVSKCLMSEIGKIEVEAISLLADLEIQQQYADKYTDDFYHDNNEISDDEEINLEELKFEIADLEIQQTCADKSTEEFYNDNEICDYDEFNQEELKLKTAEQILTDELSMVDILFDKKQRKDLAQ